MSKRSLRSLVHGFHGLRKIGLRWSIAISIYVGVGLLIIGANHGYWSEYLAPTYIFPNIYPATFLFGLTAGATASVSSSSAILTYLANAGRKPSNASNLAHLHSMALIAIVVGIGFLEIYLVPAMLSPTNCGFLFFLSATAGLATYLHFQILPGRSKEASPKPLIVELKLSHAEALEIFRTMVQTCIIVLTGGILYAIIVYSPNSYPPASIQYQSVLKSLLLTLSDVAYGILGYVFFCIGASIEKLQLIRSKVLELGIEQENA